MSIAYTYTLNGQRTSHEQYPLRWSSFNEAIQPGLLQKFESRGIAIDPYFGAEFEGDGLAHLLDALKHVRNQISDASDLLGFNDQWLAFYEDYRTSTDTPKASALISLNTLASFIERAQCEGEAILFIGD